MFIVMINYKKPMEIVESYVVAHRAYLEEGYQKNYFVVSGPRNPRTGGLIVSQLNNREQLVKFLSQDPFILNDVAEYEYIEFNPVKYHPDFTKFLESI